MGHESEEQLAIQATSRESHRQGKLAGIRLAADTVQKWAEKALGEGRPSASTEGLTLEEAAANLTTIADRLEEEG